MLCNVAASLFKMYTKLIVISIVLTSSPMLEAFFRPHLVGEPIENGYIKHSVIYCQIVCNYGFISSGKQVFLCIEEHPTCVKTMAFIIGM